MKLRIALTLALWSLGFGLAGAEVDLPPLRLGVNDLAGMFPQASFDVLDHRLHRFHTETANSVSVLTLKSLEDESIDAVARRALQSLPVSDLERQRSVVLVVARKEREVTFAAGEKLRPLLPQPVAGQNLLAKVALYWDGMRSDLGIHGAVDYLIRVLRGDVRVGSQTEEEKLQQTSLSGGEAGAIFALCLAPFLAFFIGVLWGIYATQYGVQRYPRLLMSAIFGGATAKIVAMLMSVLGSYSDNLWYFIMALAIPLSIFGSLTEFWMAGGDWRGIPRTKGPKRKPEDNMGI